MSAAHPIAEAVAVEVTTHAGCELVLAHAEPGCAGRAATPAVAKRYRIPPVAIADLPELAWPCAACISTGPARAGHTAWGGPTERGEATGAASGVEILEPAAVEAWLLALGRKVDPEDVTAALRGAANRWAKTYDGDFEYMVEMRKQASEPRGVTVGQAKGVLNCWRAEILRRRPTPAPAPAPAPGEAAATAPAYEANRGDVHVIDGAYYRVSVGQNSGKTYLTRWTGNSWEYAAGASRLASATTLATAEQAAAFGHAYNKCVFCTHDLDVDRSITVGYGPKCAAKQGLPW